MAVEPLTSSNGQRPGASIHFLCLLRGKVDMLRWADAQENLESVAETVAVERSRR